jgi:excisionase family DNA binding protein
MMLHRTDLKTCYVGLLWISRHRKLYGQSPDPAVERAIERLEDALAMSATGPEGQAPVVSWLTTKQAAERLQCSTRHVRRIAERLGGRRDGRDWLIPERML